MAGRGDVRRQRDVRALPREAATGVEGLGPRPGDGHEATERDRPRRLHRRRASTARDDVALLPRRRQVPRRDRGPGRQAGSDFEVTYIFGWRARCSSTSCRFPGGRLQCLTIAWDTQKKRWFSPLSGPGHPARRLAALDAQRPELERHVRRVPLHEPAEGLRRRDGDVRRPRGPRSTSAARPATAPARATWRGRRVPPMARPRVEDQGLVVPHLGHQHRASWSSCARRATRAAPSSATTTTPAACCSTTCCRRC